MAFLKLLLDGDSLTVTTLPVADHAASGLTMALVANEAQSFGDVCYIEALGQAALADADAEGSSRVCLMCAELHLNAGSSGLYLLHGTARDDSWDWTSGLHIYLSTTGTVGNTLTQNIPTGADDAIVVTGIATSVDYMYFNPSLIVVEHV